MIRKIKKRISVKKNRSGNREIHVRGCSEKYYRKSGAEKHGMSENMTVWKFKLCRNESMKSKFQRKEPMKNYAIRGEG